MKKLLILLLIATGAKVQTTTPDSAKYFEGSLKTVCGHVSQTYLSGTQNTFINFGTRPNCFLLKLNFQMIHRKQVLLLYGLLKKGN